MRKPRKYLDYIKRMFIAHSMIVMVIIFCLYLATLLVSYQILVVQKTTAANQRIHSIVKTDLNALNREMEQFVNEPSTKQAFNDSSLISSVNERLYAFRKTRTFKINFALVNQQGTVLSTNLYANNQKVLEQSSLKSRIMKQLDKGMPVQQRLEISDLSYGQESRYLFGYPILNGEQILGYLLLFLESDQTSVPAITEFTLLTDRFGNVIYTSDSLLVSKLGKGPHELQIGQSSIQIGEQQYFVIGSALQNGFVVYNLTPVRLFRQVILIGIASFTLILIILCLLMIGLSPEIMRESRSSFANLLTFIESPKAVRGEQSFLEFQQIEEAFRKKMIQIDDLILRNQLMEETKRKMEIKQLENQFNPHFAFNVLEMLRYEIGFDPKNAQEMIISFANLMRYSTYYGDTTVLLATDLKYVSDYLKLQKMRFQDRLDYTIYVEEGLEQAAVPKLLLQPIIENSIKHNIEAVRRLLLDIHIYRIRGDLQITVTDSGLGIDSSTLYQLKKMLSGKKETTGQYGLFYCQRIIELEYGKAYGLTIKNNETESGTCVVITLPFHREGSTNC